MRVPVDDGGNDAVERAARPVEELHDAQLFVVESRRASMRARLHAGYRGRRLRRRLSELHHGELSRLRCLIDGFRTLAINEAQIPGILAVAQAVDAPRADRVRRFVVVRAGAENAV